MIPRTLNYEHVNSTIIKTMVDYIKANSLKSVVLGISGGIDSTLVAAILHQVSEEVKEYFPEFQFIGVSMPTDTTNPEEHESALLVGETFCDRFIDLNENVISGLAKRFWYDAVDKTEEGFKLRFGNIKSRLRTVFLYDTAKANQGMVVGTDNYTEYLLGFSTIGGDALFDYCPIQYLWKTEVFDYSEWLINKYLKEKKFKLASAISLSMSLKPQDGLGISDSDMDQIGAKDYYEVDTILWSIENGRPVLEVEQEAVVKVIQRHEGTEYKRKLPICIPRQCLC